MSKDAALENGLERAAQGFVAEYKTTAQRLVWNNPLSPQQQFIGQITGQAVKQGEQFLVRSSG
jgi:hypothetical protein